MFSVEHPKSKPPMQGEGDALDSGCTDTKDCQAERPAGPRRRNPRLPSDDQYGHHNLRRSSWRESINLNGRTITFKLDTGSEVTAISKETLQKIQRPILERPTSSLHGPSHQSLKVAGQFSGKLSYRPISTRQQAFVVEDLSTNLLGLPAITALKLATRTYNADQSQLYKHSKVTCESLTSDLQVVD